MCKTVLKRPQALIGLLLILLVVFSAFFAPVLAPHNPEKTDLTKKFLTPCAEYPLGTDDLGRCELSRLLYGTRTSLSIAFPVLLLLALIGLFLGTLTVCTGEAVDHLMTLICDVFISFPQLVIAIAMIGILGVGVFSLIIAILAAMWAWFVRMVRSWALLEMGKDYILSARIAGCGTLKLIFRHLMPNIFPQFLVFLSTGVSSIIVMVSGFAFLGLGLPPEMPEWGAMLNSARNTIFSHPELLLYPGLCIMLASAGFNLFGEALRDVLEGNT